VTEVAGNLRIPLAVLRRQSRDPYSFVRTACLENLSLISSRVVGNRVDVKLTVEVDGGELIARGTLRAGWIGECRRCLEPVAGSLDLAVREVFAEEGGGGNTGRSVGHSVQEADVYPLGVEHLDLEPMVRDALLLALPLSPLCAPDCFGPDPERFPAGRSTDTGRDRPVSPPDPRWSVLDGLRRPTRDRGDS
jgi:uncharacterized protein